MKHFFFTTFFRHKTIAFLIYLFFFLILFLQLPLRKEISGNCDTWLALSYSSYSLESIKSFLTGTEPGSPMHPVHNPLAYGESAPGIQLPIIIMKYLGLSDYWVNYLYISAIFSLTAFAIFVFAGNFTVFFPAKMLAGFIFTVNNISFAHIDDSIIIFFFFPVLALHFLFRWFHEKNIKFLVLSSVLAGIQIYFSFYVFFYQFVMIFIFSAVSVFKNRVKLTELIKPAALYLLISAAIFVPHLLFYLKTIQELEFVEIFDKFYTVKMASINPLDFILVLPDNLIYPDLGKMTGIPMNWGFVRHYNFTGLIALALFIYSFFKWNNFRLFLGMTALAGLFLAAGPVFMFNMKEVFYSPLYVFYKLIPALGFLRVAVRAHFIFLFAMSIGAALSTEKLFKGKKYQNFFISAMFLLHFFESTPLPIKGFDASMTDKVPMIYNYIKKMDGRPLIIELPSRMDVEFLNWDDSIFNDPAEFIFKGTDRLSLKVENISMFVNSWDDIFQYNREIIYTNWQTSHKIDSVNGVNGYFPVPRMMYQYHINRLPDKKSFQTLKKWGVNYIVWHESMK
ncbi:MAG TPA: hypothetical protein PKN76_12805, partial [bacterium]|nr:hypothetical protein [bacterium]